MTRFVVVPQWQGSSSSRAMQLVDGADAIAGDLPRSATTRLDIPLEAGDALGTGVHRLSALHRVRAQVEEAIGGTDETVVVVGGDCGVALGAVAAVAGEDLAVVWLDAHADAHNPETSASGAFHGMVLRSILGDGPDGMTVQAGVITPSRVVLAGARSLDLEEELYVAGSEIRMLAPSDLSNHEALADAVEATGAARVYIHVDLDVLDPAEITGVGLAEPFGVSTADLVGSIRALRARLPLAGASLTEFSPSSPDAAVDDLGTILRIVGALA
ncbi:arginase family protein [Microbacterium hatanonis]|uniref:Arginase family protein n=1 Tax=Microbacterium hatanonis TaxID=404366 RepID=A0A5C8I3D7_9MICO|nr:arginase family protein [Microbacterium hatanonis]TXK13542.1 arginase family protein [Microbacterium hatanonis]